MPEMPRVILRPVGCPSSFRRSATTVEWSGGFRIQRGPFRGSGWPGRANIPGGLANANQRFDKSRRGRVYLDGGALWFAGLVGAARVSGGQERDQPAPFGCEPCRSIGIGGICVAGDG